VNETELAEIEARISTYPPDAQADLRWLSRELRKAYNLGIPDAGLPASAIYDTLTGLLSGGAYGVRFSMARARARRYKKLFAVMSVDVTLPEEDIADPGEAEEILRQVAERLVACARATDTVARIDREKFAVILEELAHPDHAERVKQKVETALGEPLLLPQRVVCASVYVTLQFYEGSRAGEGRFA